MELITQSRQRAMAYALGMGCRLVRTKSNKKRGGAPSLVLYTYPTNDSQGLPMGTMTVAQWVNSMSTSSWYYASSSAPFYSIEGPVRGRRTDCMHSFIVLSQFRNNKAFAKWGQGTISTLIGSQAWVMEQVNPIEPTKDVTLWAKS